MSLYGKCLSPRFKHTYWLLLLADSKQRLEDRLEDISFPSLSASLYVADNERCIDDTGRYGNFFRLHKMRFANTIIVYYSMHS